MSFSSRPRRRATLALIIAAFGIIGALGGCGPQGALPRPDFAKLRVAGYAVADEPRAAAIGRDILAQGGSATDAGVALALALTVTLPSRASLGGGGACLLRGGRDATEDQLLVKPPPPAPLPVESIAFLPGPAKQGGGIGLPMLARGLAAAHAKYGRLRWEQVVAPAEKLALFGAPVSRAFIRDIAAAGAEITGPTGKTLAEGDLLPQGELGETLAVLRQRGAADLYTGRLAASFVAESDGAVDPVMLRQAIPEATMPAGVAFGRHTVYFSATPAGTFARMLWSDAAAEPADTAGIGRLWRAVVGTPDATATADGLGRMIAEAAASAVKEAAPPSGGDAATGFVVVDWRGAAMACSVTMGRLFGAGKVIGETGIIASVPVTGGAPDAVSGAALLVVNENTSKLLGAFAGGGDRSGPQGMVETALAAFAAPLPVDRALALPRAYGAGGTVLAEPKVPALGQVAGVACRSGLPSDQIDCTAAADPRGAGFAETAERIR
jgi:gamma-glutamyltranspeptidase/glutathione hydrolase